MRKSILDRMAIASNKRRGVIDSDDFDFKPYPTRYEEEAIKTARSSAIDYLMRIADYNSGEYPVLYSRDGGIPIYLSLDGPNLKYFRITNVLSFPIVASVGLPPDPEKMLPAPVLTYLTVDVEGRNLINKPSKDEIYEGVLEQNAKMVCSEQAVEHSDNLGP